MTHPSEGAHPPRPQPDVGALLDKLTPEQRRAVCHGPGPLLLIAGPGAGKTKTLIHRIARLLETGAAQPWEILAVTFSVRAAGELRLRLADLLGEQIACGVTAATFHSICARMLREHARVFGRTENYTVYDQTDVRRVIEWLLSDQQRGQIQQALADYGQPAAAEVLAEISLAKNRLLSPDSYQQQARHAAAPLIAAVWREAEIELQRSNAWDFDDLMTHAVRLLAEHPHRLAFYRQRWKWLVVDEYQDTNEAQSVLVALLAGAGGNVCCVGDDDQCVAEGTAVTMADGTRRRIEKLQPGEFVLSSYGRGDLRPARVTSVRRRDERDDVRVTLKSDRTLTSTADHTHFAGFEASHARGRFFTYLMWRADKGFRVGVATGSYAVGRDDKRFGPAQRGLIERADKVWAISVHDREVEGRLAEATLAARYGLPTIPFVAVAGGDPNRSVVSDQEQIDRLFAALDTSTCGMRLLENEGLAFDLPHYQPHARTMLARHGEARYVVHVSLCAQRRGATAMHRIAIQGADDEGRRSLEQLGLPVRAAGKGTDRWLFETVRRNYGEVLALGEVIAHRLGGVLRLVAAVGPARAPGRHAVRLPLLPARHVRRGMVMVTEDGTLEVVDAVDRVRLDKPVYDLNVEGTHNFIANGIITHNCLYGFRGAEARNMLCFGERFPAHERIVLGRNFRSRSEILEPAARCIAHNQRRLPKALIATRGVGGEARVVAYGSDRHEADSVAAAIAQTLAQGVPAGEVLVLARTGYATGPLQAALARAGIPHRVLGSLGLYERSEVRDALAYLTLLANPADAQAFRRAVGSPKRGVGTATANRVVALARDTHRGDLITASAHATAIESIRPPVVRDRLRRFGEGLEHVRGDLRAGRSIGHVVVAAVTLDGGLVQHHQQRRDTSPRPEQRQDAERVLEDLRSLCRAAQAYEEQHADDATLTGFLEQVAGLHAHEIAPGEPDRRITVSTIHRSKGTEAQLVVLLGCEERLLPFWRALQSSDPEQLAEERRLFYVACTRAKDQLILTHAAMRGGRPTGGPSRFLSEARLIDPPQALAA